MKNLHYFSAIIISIFVSFHLLNHILSILSLEAHIEMMEVFRKVYRNMWVETLLLLAVLVQIVSGGKLFLTKRKLQLDAFQKLQLWSGLYLAVFLLIHISGPIGTPSGYERLLWCSWIEHLSIKCILYSLLHLSHSFLLRAHHRHSSPKDENINLWYTCSTTIKRYINPWWPTDHPHFVWIDQWF